MTATLNPTPLEERLAGDVTTTCLEGFISILGWTRVAILQTGLGKFGVLVETENQEPEILIATTSLSDAVAEYRYAVNGLLSSGARRRLAERPTMAGLAAFRTAASYKNVVLDSSDDKHEAIVETKAKEKRGSRKGTFYGMTRRVRPKGEVALESGISYIPDPDVIDLPSRVFALGQRPIALVGPSGCGKSLFVDWLSCESGLRLYSFLHTAQTESEDIIGKFVPDGKGGFHFEDGPLTIAVKNGGIYFADEITASKPGVNMIYNNILNGEPLVVEGDAGHRVIIPHPEFRFVAAFNPANTYEGNHAMNLSQIGRYVVFNWDYPTQEHETRAILARKPEFGNAAAEMLAEIACAIRKAMAKREDVRYTVTTRDLVKCAELVVDAGCTIARAAEICIVNPIRLFEDDAVAREIQPILAKRLPKDA